MPFSTVERSYKRFRPTDAFDIDEDDLYSHYFTPPHSMVASMQPPATISSNYVPTTTTTTQRMYQRKTPVLPTIDTMSDFGSLQYNNSPLTPLESGRGSIDMGSSFDNEEIPEGGSPTCTINNSQMILQDTSSSKFHISYTDLGFSIEARLANVSDLRMLIDAFSSICMPSHEEDHHHHHGDQSSTPSSTSPQSTNSSNKGIVLYRNRSSRTKPVNFFASVSSLGQLMQPHSKHGPRMSLRQIMDLCIDTYFTCWVRYTSILARDEFMTWYKNHPSPSKTLIVNAICCHIFRHAMVHHAPPELSRFFLTDTRLLNEQEEFFFNRARDCLAQSFDCPDRHMVVALLLMGSRAEPSRQHQYAGMAVQALHELEIYPRVDTDTDNESFDKEMDTRLWWYAWAIDFYLYSSGLPKNTPQTRSALPVDLPRVFEQDIDEAEIGVLAHVHCLVLWRMQAEIVNTFYEQDSEMTVEQLHSYDTRLLTLYEQLPAYLRFNSGFEYGCEDLFVACLRVNIEYNATRMILHKLFIPDVNDSYHPSRFSLESLNICLSTALRQLRTLNTCLRTTYGPCAFDRDELWRAAEIISMAMDIHRACGSPIILQQIDRDEYEQGLEIALEMLKRTPEYQVKCKDWIQVADWLDAELRRHQLYHAHPDQSSLRKRPKSPDFFLANLKPSARQQHQQQHPDHHQQQSSPSSSSSPVTANDHTILEQQATHELTPSGSMLSVLSFPPPPPPPPSSSHQQQQQQQQQQFNMSYSTPFSSSITSYNAPPPPPPSQQSTSSSDHTHTKAFVHFNPYTPPTPPPSHRRSSSSSTSSRSSTIKANNQTRFRYFNPRKMNKFLFIDENPTL
ncbi:hypothetical protein RO3G_00462 [Lichtheimia corymbifera JMRC:FSU:9682]|uniref:Transcription factor domain-containing protein n=1 Tax=Lichtheimia corymbifera JMRC:FSU:9682 TaxID=1263082 RepID=A0A068S3P3_9FUNG|nr:hypothetical protein RO3G_00462 [Lichtheimia corymbifera JMRC:FSU:9682]